MQYKQKLYFLSGIISLLALVYVLTLVFDPERVGTRTAAFTWLDPKFRDSIDAIEIHGPAADTTLVRKNNVWFVSAEGAEYPARQFRVDDLLGLLTRRGSYPVQAASASAQERLGLTETAASRIIVRGGAGLPLLDLLVGNGNVTGRNIYLRKAGQNEVRSGEDRLSGYTISPRNSWYNLRLFPDSEDGSFDTDTVQRLTVYPPAEVNADGTPAADSGAATVGGTVTDSGADGRPPIIFTRAGEGWSISSMTVSDPDKNKVDTYIRSILNTEGEDFISVTGLGTAPGEWIAAFNDGRVILELGNGSVRTIRFGPVQGESNQRYAAVSGSPYVYALASWAVDRIFREVSFFEK